MHGSKEETFFMKIKNKLQVSFFMFYITTQDYNQSVSYLQRFKTLFLLIQDILAVFPLI